MASIRSGSDGEPPGTSGDGLEVVRIGTLGVQYEPIVEIATGRVHGFEALARFHRRDGLTVPPACVFERLRAAPDLLVETELALKRLQIAHAPGTRLYLNVSPETWALASESLLDVLDVPGREIVVEATENVHAGCARRGLGMLRDLERAGISAALDDLGVENGLVSADELHLANVLKFDRSVLRRLGDPSRRALIEALLEFARRTDKLTVAEGVETHRDLALVTELGFGFAQGMLFSDRYRRWMPQAPLHLVP